MKECPDTKYADEENVCQTCHKNCVGGCTGKRNMIGQGGCNSCAVALLADDGYNISKCLPSNTDLTGCETGYFWTVVSSSQGGPMAGKPVSCKDLAPLIGAQNNGNLSKFESANLHTLHPNKYDLKIK